MNLDVSIFKSGTPVVEPDILNLFNDSIISVEYFYLVEVKVMQLKQDVEVLFHFIGDRRGRIYEGYRPAHMVKEGYLTTGVHTYYNINTDSNEIRGGIIFLSPEDYPACLWIGKKIEMYEGKEIIGYATITRIFNSILENKC